MRGGGDQPSGADRPVAEGALGFRRRHHRCLGFVSAVVLFVLLAAAGLPLGGALAPAQNIEAGERAVEHAARRATRGEPMVVAAARKAARALPRPLARQRCIAARGLPPARAPCV